MLAAEDFTICEETSRLLFVEGNVFGGSKRRRTGWRRIVLPQSMKTEVLNRFHDDKISGHMGIAKTAMRITDRFYWRGMYKDIQVYVRSCPLCQARKQAPKNPIGFPNRGEMLSINEASEPAEMIGVDIMGPLPETERGNKYILVVTDYLTRYCEAIALQAADAEQTAEAIMTFWILQFGTPKKLLSDRGTNFMSELVDWLCRLYRIRKLQTSSYHPQCNGLLWSPRTAARTKRQWEIHPSTLCLAETLSPQRMSTSKSQKAACTTAQVVYPAGSSDSSRISKIPGEPPTSA
eukprot:GILJ01014146.1.p1 GENE.GILJ01014146.1~~GILJ01014146.1.p1  ORF type:complete len:292 (+),score=36.92 GILJ01014146.1:1354-2229(+)